MELNRVILHNNTSNAKGSAIWFRAGDLIIQNSLFYDNYYSNSEGVGSAIALSGGRYKLINNTIANNHGYPIWAFDQNPSVLVANSILTWHDGQGDRPYFTPNNEVPSYWYNNIIKTGINTGGVFNELVSLQGFANYYFEPSFVDTSNGNYQLANNSKAISSGRTSISSLLPSDADTFFEFSLLGKDVSGGERVQPENSMVDLGAHENFQGAPSFTKPKIICRCKQCLW